MRVLLLFLACFALGSCGIKPPQVIPPEEAKDGSFPRTYPRLEGRTYDE